MSTGLDWNYDRAEDGTHKIAGEVQLREYGHFLEKYATKLQGIEQALEDSINDAWEIGLDPILLQFVPYEHSTLLELIDTDNKVLNKVLTVFATLCAEINSLRTEASTKYYDAILFYGEGGEASVQDGAAQLQLSRMLPLLQELSCLVTRCRHVTVLAVQQLAALSAAPPLISAAHLHMENVFHELGELLVILVTLDEVLDNQSLLHEHWILYKRTVKSVHHDSAKFGAHLDKLKTYEQFLNELECQLFTGKIFQKAVEQSFDNKRGIVNKSATLADEFNLYLKNSITNLESESVELLNSDDMSQFVRISAIYALNFNLFGSVDKKFFKQFWDLSRKIPSVTLVGNVQWFPEQFLLANLPHFAKMIDKKSLQVIASTRQQYLQQKSQNLPKDAALYALLVSAWMVRIETSLKRESTHLKLEDLTHRCNLFIQGLDHASSISLLLRNVTNLHVALSKPMPKTTVIALCKLVEHLKSIQHMFYRHSMTIAESMNHLVQHLAFQALTIIAAAKKSLVQDKHYSEKRLDVLSSLVLAEHMLHGPGTKERRLVACIAISIANQMKVFREDDLSNILRKLGTVCEIQQKITAACDCAFLYWHRVILPIYFNNLFESKTELHRMAYMFSAFRDCVIAMERTKHHESPQTLKDSFDKEICSCLQEQIVKPLCHQIETNLRLHAHSHLQLDDRNPFRVGALNSAPLLRMRPLRFFDRYINIKGYVEHYLDETFYNLTTVALHDWKTYGEMRSLALYKYGLATVEDHLPSQTLEQGLDVLVIMRNIHVFVSNFLYNLNNQIFVEQSSNNKHLNTINIRHIANSIRTHGTGIMNTTVNFTYQFLQKKFFIFSQFMFDEHIKSRLMKDLRSFRENKIQLEQKYSYERAEKFNNGVRKLGLTPRGESYLDQFRMLISHIGNAMGYVRMIRSGGLHCCSNAICFIPDLEDVVNFEELCKEEGLSDVCTEAAHRLDQVTGNLSRNFAEGTEYFKLLVDVFTPVFRNEKNLHLRNFHIIVPPLTINFVEHSITAKEKMSKKNKVGASFTDDGFAMGIAYILKLLDQYNELDSLHWFESVRDKYTKDKAVLGKQKFLASKDDEKLQQTMTLTARRLDMYKQEFDLLYYSLSSARIFFQKDRSELDVAGVTSSQKSS